MIMMMMIVMMMMIDDNDDDDNDDDDNDDDDDTDDHVHNNEPFFNVSIKKLIHILQRTHVKKATKSKHRSTSFPGSSPARP